MLNIIMFIICLVPIVFYLFSLKGYKLNTKTMVVIALFSACTFILSKIQLIQYPQGGGINLLSSLPILMIGLLYGTTTGMTCGLVAGLISLLGGGYIIHPAQFLLDYILPTMLLGVSGVFASDTKKSIFLGCLLAVLLKEISHILSGCVFFAQYAWEGWNPIVYSMVYNLSGTGVEGLLSTVVLTVIPLGKIRKMSNILPINKAS